MQEKIRLGNTFKTEIEGVKYSAYIIAEYVRFITSYHLIISKKKLIKFLWFKFYINEWTHDYIFGYNNEKEYYEIADVKRWCSIAISDYYNKQQNINKRKLEKERIIHKSEI